MKKILLFIFWIVWIFWFCSADWIYHNFSLWLISFVLDWQTKRTLQDKNLGATSVYQWSSNCIIPDTCWKYYQWWNNFWFTTSNFTYVDYWSLDLSSYWPNNYFNSNGTFYSNSLYTSSNWDLWWSVTDTLVARQWPCPVWFHILESWSDFVSDVSSYWISVSNWNWLRQYFYFPYAWYLDKSSWLFNSHGAWWVYWSSTAIANGRARDLYYISSNLSAVDWSDWAQWYSIRCFKNTVVEPDSSWTVIIWDTIASSSKFIVNYWNTSYEYTLSSDLTITLDTDVSKNWDIYSYAWPTWLNLFFNNTSLFYDKDKLYLGNNFWYSNNIFTPVCYQWEN